MDEEKVKQTETGAEKESGFVLPLLLPLLLFGLIIFSAFGFYYFSKSDKSGDQNIESGITGKIFIGPTCPVVRTEIEKECQDKPYKATVVVKTQDSSREITRFHSDSEGNFKVELKPGNYFLTSGENVQLPLLKPVSVEVKENKWTEVNLSFDSGIR